MDNEHIWLFNTMKIKLKLPIKQYLENIHGLAILYNAKVNTSIKKSSSN